MREASGFLGERGGGWESGDGGDERGKGIAAKSEREREREPGLEGKPAASGRGRGGEGKKSEWVTVIKEQGGR